MNFSIFFFSLSSAGEIFIRSENCKSRIITLMRVRVRTRTCTSLSPCLFFFFSIFFCFLMLNIWRMCVTISLERERERENNSRSRTRLYNQSVWGWTRWGKKKMKWQCVLSCRTNAHLLHYFNFQVRIFLIYVPFFILFQINLISLSILFHKLWLAGLNWPLL